MGKKKILRRAHHSKKGVRNLTAKKRGKRMKGRKPRILAINLVKKGFHVQGK